LKASFRVVQRFGPHRRSEILERTSWRLRGIRNIFDEDYWGEVREEGIMPALPRNYYAGFDILF